MQQRVSKSLKVREAKGSGSLVGAAETDNEVGEWQRLQQKILNTLGTLNRRGWLQRHK